MQSSNAKSEKVSEILSNIEFLLGEALKKCGNIYDAEDLTQDTLIAALSYMARGQEINDIKAFLITVMGRHFNTMLRKKYSGATVSIDDDFTAYDAVDEIGSIEDRDETRSEAENVRKAVAYLAGTYREVIVRHYMHGRSISRIAAELGIPEGTVKSRLYLGRNRIKEGVENMVKFSEQSYSPVKLSVAWSGNSGLNGEPESLVNGDLVAQNVLWSAYKKPVTVEQIALSTGIPAAYIEPVVAKLTEGELMKRIGSKYYTDFIIFTVEDKKKHIPAQKEFVRQNFSLFWDSIQKGLDSLRQCDLYKKLQFDAKNSLEMYYTFFCLDHGIYMAFINGFGEIQDFPVRPRGGDWIASGTVFFEEFKIAGNIDILSHSYSGERIVHFAKYIDCENLELHVYGADGFPCYTYNCSKDFTFYPGNYMPDGEIAKLLYILHTGTDPESVGYNPEHLKAIPWLVKCKILRYGDGGKPAVNVPVLTAAEADMLGKLTAEACNETGKMLAAPLTDFLKGRKKEIPGHLQSVPLAKQYMYADNAMLFAAVREAIARGKLYDGNYDDDSQA